MQTERSSPEINAVISARILACRKASAPRRCWLCDEPSVGLHSHFGDYVPMCAAHMAERATA